MNICICKRKFASFISLSILFIGLFTFIGWSVRYGTRLQQDPSISSRLSDANTMAKESDHYDGTMKGEGKKRYPKALIVGVKKGGTGALDSFLKKHPLIEGPGREIHFFDRNESYTKGQQYYLNEMPISFENQMTIEKSPAYFDTPYVPKRISDFDKDIKLIFTFRDPVQRAISDYAHILEEGNRETFEELVFLKSNPDKIDIDSRVVYIGLYMKHLMNWLKYFPLEQMYFVNGDELMHNPAPQLIEIQRFLGQPVLIDENSFRFDQEKGFYCFTKNGSSMCLGDNKGRKHPYVNESSIKKLTEFYKPHNRLFLNFVRKGFKWAV